MSNVVNGCDIKPIAQMSQEKIELLEQRPKLPLDRQGIWNRITEAFGTDKVQEIADRLGLKYQSVRKWKLGELPGLDTLAQIKNLTNSSIDYILTGEKSEAVQKTLLPENDSDYSNAVPIYLEEHLEAKLVQLATKENLQVSDLAAQLVIEAMIARGIVTDKVEGIQLQFFGDVEIKLSPIPLLGTIAAGQPLQIFESPDTVLVAEEFLIPNRKIYALRVQGDSMIEEGILDGDLLIIVETQEAHPGQTVVALIDGDQATVKKFYRRGSQIVLRPANPIHKDIILSADRVQIQGVVIGIQRRT
jgi:SOS regulatory protein LexA